MFVLRPYNKNKEELYNKNNPRLISRLLSQRNIDNIDEFLKCDYDALSDPYTLNGVKEASKLFCQVILEKGAISSFGDYDSDGIISSVMIHELCKTLKHDCTSFLPSRLEHGYGLNKTAIEHYKKTVKNPPNLLVILDCGSNSEEHILELKKWGVKHIIIIDHHTIEANKATKSANVLINWHIDNKSEMCTCGLVYQFIRGIRKLTKRIDPIEYLTYAAIGTIADIMPIIGDNRIIVKNGLLSSTLNKVSGSGLNSILSTRFSNGLNQKNIAYQVVPKLNAPGRIHTPDFVLKFLIERNSDQTEKMLELLNKLNKERKSIQERIEKEALNKINGNIDAYKHGILVYDDKWHVGVVGIVASKLVERFKKPVVIAGLHEKLYKGSSRANNDINIYEILTSCKELFTEFGGHKQAAGIILNPDKLNDASTIFNNACQKYLEKHNICTESSRFYDAELKAKTVNVETKNMLLDTLYPYCASNNPEPIFMISGIVTGLTLKEKDDWKKMSFKIKQNNDITELNFVTFSPEYGTDLNGCFVKVYFTFPQNEFNDVLVEEIVVKNGEKI